MRKGEQLRASLIEERLATCHIFLFDHPPNETTLQPCPLKRRLARDIISPFA